ncbi:MAG: restriction endonuclease subunit S [Candidatus Doudnabacteria bacterium]
MLKDLVDIISGAAIYIKDYSENGQYPVVQASDIVSNTKISELSNLPKLESLPARSPAVIHQNDILMLSRSTPGKEFRSSLVQSEQKSMANSSLYIIRIKDKKVNPEYLNFYLNSPAFQSEIMQKARGSTIMHISKSVLGETSILLPSLEQQKTIVDLYNNVIKQINLHDKQKQLKRDILKTIFLKLQNNV